MQSLLEIMKGLGASFLRGLLVVLLLGLALTVWPTLWRYDHVGGTPVRYHRITAKSQLYQPAKGGWITVRPPICADPLDSLSAIYGGPPCVPRDSARR